MKLKIKPDSSSPSKEMEFGREEVTQNRLKQLNKGSCLYDVCKKFDPHPSLLLAFVQPSGVVPEDYSDKQLQSHQRFYPPLDGR